jgi:hypothetical protein
MQPKLLCPRRSRFAPKTHRWEIPNHKYQITKQQVPNYKTNRIWNLIFLKGYVKELLRLKNKQIRMYCQGFVISGLSGFKSYSGKLGDEFNPLPQSYILFTVLIIFLM